MAVRRDRIATAHERKHKYHDKIAKGLATFQMERDRRLIGTDTYLVRADRSAVTPPTARKHSVRRLVREDQWPHRKTRSM